MIGYSPKLPLVYDKVDGPYSLNKNIKDLTKQNLKMLVLTNPGERVMIPDFGVGIRRYLFSQDAANVREAISSAIYKQTSRFMPYITITELIFSEPGSNDYNTLYLSINYTIDSSNINDQLNIQI